MCANRFSKLNFFFYNDYEKTYKNVKTRSRWHPCQLLCGFFCAVKETGVPEGNPPVQIADRMTLPQTVTDEQSI